VPPSGVRDSWRPCRWSLGSWPGGSDSPCTLQQHVLIDFWQASAREEVSAILGKGSPGRDQDELHCCQYVHRHNGPGRLPKKNLGGTFYASPTQGHLSCEEHKRNTWIKSKHTHAITHCKTKAPIEYMRYNTQWSPTDYNTPKSQRSPKTKQKNNIQIHVSTTHSDVLVCSECCYRSLQSIPWVFMTFPRLSQIQSINWLCSTNRAQGTPISGGSQTRGVAGRSGSPLVRRRNEIWRSSFPRCWPTWISRPRHLRGLPPWPTTSAQDRREVLQVRGAMVALPRGWRNSKSVR